MSKSEVLSIGSLVIDVINGEKKIGGASANAAVDMKMLGAQSALLTGLSEETDSVDYQQYLSQIGIPVYGLPRTLKQLPRCVIHMGEDGKEVGYDWFGNGIEELFQSAEVDSELIKRYPMIYLAICEQVFALKVSRSVKTNQVLSYNPGSRVFDDLEYFKAIQPRADFIFLNEREYGHLLSQGVIQKPEDLIVKNGQVAIITAGSKDTILVSSEAVKYVSPESVVAIDETGAGDSFASAFLWARMQGYPFETCVKIGNLLASFVVQQVGCQIDLETTGKFKIEAKKRGLIK